MTMCRDQVKYIKGFNKYNVGSVLRFPKRAYHGGSRKDVAKRTRAPPQDRGDKGATTQDFCHIGAAVGGRNAKQRQDMSTLSVNPTRKPKGRPTPAMDGKRRYRCRPLFELGKVFTRA